MAARPGLCTLVLGAALAAVQACEELDPDVAGSPRLTVSLIYSAANCNALCVALDWCNWYTWIHPPEVVGTWNCLLKEQRGIPAGDALKASRTSGARCASGACFDPENFTYSGDEHSSHAATAAGECGELCSASPSCESWTWSAQTCSLKSSLMPGRQSVAAGTALSGIPCRGATTTLTTFASETVPAAPTTVAGDAAETTGAAVDAATTGAPFLESSSSASAATSGEAVETSTPAATSPPSTATATSPPVESTGTTSTSRIATSGTKTTSQPGAALPAALSSSGIESTSQPATTGTESATQPATPPSATATQPATTGTGSATEPPPSVTATDTSSTHQASSSPASSSPASSSSSAASTTAAPRAVSSVAPERGDLYMTSGAPSGTSVRTDQGPAPSSPVPTGEMLSPTTTSTISASTFSQHGRSASDPPGATSTFAGLVVGPVAGTMSPGNTGTTPATSPVPSSRGGNSSTSPPATSLRGAASRPLAATTTTTDVRKSPAEAVSEALALQTAGILELFAQNPNLTIADAPPGSVVRTAGWVLDPRQTVGSLQLQGTAAALVLPTAALAEHSQERLGCLLSYVDPAQHRSLDAKGTEGGPVEVLGAVSVELWSIPRRVPLKVQNLPPEQLILVRIPVAGNVSRGGLECAFWDPSQGRWSTEGLTTVSQDDGTLECSSSHLTLFAAIQRGFIDSLRCANLHLFSEEAVREAFRGDWPTAPIPALYLAVLSAFLLLLLTGVLLDLRRSRCGDAIWTDGCFLLTDVYAESDVPSRSSSLSVVKRTCCAATMASTWVTIKGSSALRDALDDVASRWVNYFSELRDLCENLVERLRGCEVGTVGAVGLASAVSARAAAFTGSLVLKSVRRQAGASLRLSDEVMAFVTEDVEISGVLVRALLLKAESRQPTEEEEAFLAWGRLHEAATDAMDTHWEAFGNWRAVPGACLRQFLAQTPVGKTMLGDPFLPSGLRVLLLLCSLSGSFALAGLFFQATGDMRGKRSRGDCPGGGVGETIGRLLSIALASTLLSGIPVALLSSLHSRSIKRYKPGDWRALLRQRRLWRLQDRVLWCLGLAYVGACNAFVCVFLANVHPLDQPSYGTSGAISLMQEVIVAPLTLAIALPTLANGMLAFTSWLQGIDRRATMVQRRRQLATQANWGSLLI